MSYLLYVHRPFLPRDAVHSAAYAMVWTVRCPSVFLSVTFVCCSETAISSDFFTILEVFFCTKHYGKIPTGFPLTERRL